MAQPRCDHYEGAIINKFKSTTVHLRVVLQQYVEPVSFCRPEFDSFYVRLLFSRCLTCSLDLQDIQWAMENSRNTHKLARTPLANQKKKTTTVSKFPLFLLLLTIQVSLWSLM
jgi:hypothetical protein